MEIRPYTHHFIVLGLLGLTVLALVRGVEVTDLPDAGIRTELPDALGGWKGEHLFYCTNSACMAEYRASQLDTPGVCPRCKLSLTTDSPWERHYLPADTTVLRKCYRKAYGQEVYVSIVLSGRDRSSIHRPQLCLVGQGLEILRSRVIQVPVDAGGTRAVGVMVLDLDKRGRDAGGQAYASHSYFAYWFAGPGRETPYHLQRMVWMAVDRLFRGRSYRWSYIAVSGARKPGSDEHMEEIQSFIAELHPQLAAP